MTRAASVSDGSEYRPWERQLIVLALLLFLGSLYLYVSHYPLRRYLFNIEDEGRGQPVGTVSAQQGGLRRQVNGESEFKSIDVSDALYDGDTLMTGPEGTARLLLEDSSSIELAPNTMVRLHFQDKLTLGGISRAASVDVVAGNVRPDNETKVEVRKPARPAPPPRVAVAVPPRPVPTAKSSAAPVPAVNLIKGLELISPRQGTQLALPKWALVPEKPITFTWRISPPERQVQLTLWKLASRAPGAARTQLYREVVMDAGGQGSVFWTLTSPGYYQWEIRGPKGEPIPGAKKSSAEFSLDPDFEAIEPLEPLVGGQLLGSSRLVGKLRKSFDITLRWKAYEGAPRYKILVRTQSRGKTVLEKVVQQPQYLFNKDRVYSGQIYYEVLAPLPGGFVAHSAEKPFAFTFLAPVPMVPANHAVLSRDDLENENDSVLVTWQKTNFTEWYELQIAKDPGFTNFAVKEKLKENFFIFKSPEAAKYYWRVRSSAQSVLSPFSPSYDLTIQR